MKKIILLMVGILFIVPLLTAGTVYKEHQILDLKVPCSDDGDYCSATTECNITVDYPNSTNLVNNQIMTNQASFHNYTFSSSQISVSGEYPSTMKCCDSGTCGLSRFSLKITPSGEEFDEGKGIAAFAVLIGSLGVAFIFLVIGYNLSSNPKTIPLSFFFIVLAVFLAIYSLNLGYSYTHDILQYESLAPVSEIIYIGFLWLIVGIAIISMALMLISFIKEMMTIKKVKNYGNGFNPITDTYE